MLNFKKHASDSESSDEDGLNDEESSSDDNSEDEKAIRQFNRQKMNNIAGEKQLQLMQENKKINLNYVDHKLEISLNNKVKTALNTQ